MAEPFIHLSGVRKLYRRRDTEYLAISDASFDVMPGELVALVGPSGCGKTTLLKILAGLHGHDGGEVKIGSAPTRSIRHATSAWCSSSRCCSNGGAFSKTCCCRPKSSGLPLAASRERAMQLLELVGLAGFEHKYPYELSGGMQQRAAIARALVHDPKLILMDEPFGALDALTREKMNLELLRIWKESQKTIIFVTHGISEAVFLGTRVVVLTAGPARMADNITIELPHPRTLDMKTDKDFGDYTRHIYKLLGME